MVLAPCHALLLPLAFSSAPSHTRAHTQSQVTPRSRLRLSGERAPRRAPGPECGDALRQAGLLIPTPTCSHPCSVFFKQAAPPLSPSALRPRRSFSCTHTAGPHRIRTTSCRAAAQHRARSHRACGGGKGPCQIEDRPPARQRVLRAADAAGALPCLEPPPGPLHSVARWSDGLPSGIERHRGPPRATALARLPCGRWQRGGVVCRLHCASSDV